MAKVFLVPIDMTQLEIQNHVLHKLGSAPGSPVEGQLYFNTATDTLEFHNGTGFISLGRLDQIEAPTADVSMNSQKLTNLAAPVGNNDAARKADVDAVAAGLNWKDSVRAATTAAGTLASSFENGDTIDGVTLATGDRILIKNQAAGAENGIYTVNVSGAPTRATDADTGTEILAASVFVEEGTSNADTVWVLTTNAPITINTTSLAFTQFGAGSGFTVAGAGLTASGSTVDVIAGATPGTAGPGGGLKVNADDVVIDVDVVVRKYAASFGDGAATSFNIDHNLNDLDVTVEVFRNSDGVKVETDVTHSTVNRVIIATAAVPTSNQYRVVVHA